MIFSTCRSIIKTISKGQTDTKPSAGKGALIMSFDPYEFDRGYTSSRGDTLGQYTAKTFQIGRAHV